MNPYEKYVRLELVLIIAALLIGLIALLKGFILLLIVSFYLLTGSFFLEVAYEWMRHRKEEAGKQLVRAILLFFFTTYLFIVLIL